MTVAVKICGMTSADAIDAAVSAGATYGGLVFHPNSPRNVGLEQARALADRMRGRLQIVALIADMDDAGIANLTRTVRPDFLQLHGSESARRAAYIRAKFDVPVIKALPVSEPADLSAAAEYEDAVDMLMFDAARPRAPSAAAVMARPLTGKSLAAKAFPSRGSWRAVSVRKMWRARSNFPARNW